MLRCLLLVIGLSVASSSFAKEEKKVSEPSKAFISEAKRMTAHFANTLMLAHSEYYKTEKRKDDIFVAPYKVSEGSFQPTLTQVPSHYWFSASVMTNTGWDCLFYAIFTDDSKGRPSFTEIKLHHCAK